MLLTPILRLPAPGTLALGPMKEDGHVHVNARQFFP
jgi:hypothetical protein